MKLIKDYIQNFLKRAGSYVFFATIFARLFSFFGSWVALQLIPNKELGIVLFAFSIIQFLIPMGGFGLNQGLIRYGALLDNFSDKNALFVYVLKKGIITSFLLIALVSIIAMVIPFQFEKTGFYLSLLSLVIITTYLFEIIRSQFRLNHNNKLFAYTEFVYSIILVISISTLSYYFKELGYAIALIATPLITTLLFINKVKIRFKNVVTLDFIDLKFWKYGFYASLSNVVTQLLFMIDIILIGYLLSNAEIITIYRYITLIPFSLLFLPRVFISTDFVAFTEKIYDSTYIKKYIKSYLSLFSIVSVGLISFSWLFKKYLLGFFGSEFLEHTTVFMVLIFGITGIYILRNLFGNLLSSIGKAIYNYYIMLFALCINIISNYYLIPKYGILAAASTTAVLMWLTGFATWFFFTKLYRKVLTLQPFE